MKKKNQIILIILFTLIFSVILNLLNILLRKTEIDLSILVFILCIGLVSYYSSLFIVGKISKNHNLIKSKITSVICLLYIFLLFSLFFLRLARFNFFYKLEFKYMPPILLFFSGIIAIFLSRNWAVKFREDQVRFLAAFFLGVGSFYLFIIYFGFSVYHFFPDRLYIFSGILIILVSIIVNILSVCKKRSKNLYIAKSAGHMEEKGVGARKGI